MGFKFVGMEVLMAEENVCSDTYRLPKCEGYPCDLLCLKIHGDFSYGGECKYPDMCHCYYLCPRKDMNRRLLEDSLVLPHLSPPHTSIIN